MLLHTGNFYQSIYFMYVTGFYFAVACWFVGVCVFIITCSVPSSQSRMNVVLTLARQLDLWIPSLLHLSLFLNKAIYPCTPNQQNKHCI